MAESSSRKCAGVHWVAPAIILASLVSGVLLAMGHHFFYQSLEGNKAPTNSYKFLGTKISRQETNTAIGTAFAFLVKVALVSAVSTAYVQFVWRAMLHSAKTATIGSLDVLFSGISSIVSLFKVGTWRRYPVLFIIVLVAWLVPIASVITPATLSIESALPDPLPWSLRHVPNLQWVSLGFVSDMGMAFEDVPVASPFEYNGPSNEVLGITRAVSSSGSILPIPISLPNASWTLEFSGPAVYCNDVSSTERARIANNVVAEMATRRMGNGDLMCQPYGFLAWSKVPYTPGITPSADGLPFVEYGNGSYAFNTATFVDGNGQAPATFRLLSAPFVWDWYWEQGSTGYPVCDGNAISHKSALLNSSTTMLDCQLLNSTYHATFHYVNGNQTIETSAKPITNQPLVSNNLIYINDWDYTCPKSDEVLITGADSCGFHSTILSTLSYQAIMDAFQRQILGTVYADSGTGSTAGTSLILSTALLHSPELKFLRTRAGSTFLLEDVLSGYKQHQGLVNTVSSDSTMPLSDMIESLFRNITISMMSSDQLQPNVSSQYAPPQANVTLREFHNIYFYSAQKLWIAYGLAIAFSTLAAVAGLIVMAVTGASYSDGFSSIFRVSRSADSNVVIEAGYIDGRSPLPESLSQMPLKLKNTYPVTSERLEPDWSARKSPSENQQLLGRSHTL